MNESQVDAHAIACLEVWGGNGAVEERVEVPGIDAWVFSKPIHGDAHGGDVYYAST